MKSEQMLSRAAPGTENKLSLEDLEHILFSVCDGCELLPWRLHGDPCGGKGGLAEERALEPSPVALAQNMSPTVLGTEKEPSPVALEQMPSCWRPRCRGWNRSRCLQRWSQYRCPGATALSYRQ